MMNQYTDPLQLRPGVTKVNPKRPGYFMARNSWEDANTFGILTDVAFKIGRYVARNNDDHVPSISQLARSLRMSRNTIKAGIDNLMLLGVAQKGLNGGYDLSLDIEIPLTGCSGIEQSTCSEIDHPPALELSSTCSEIDHHYKTKTNPSPLRSEGKTGSVLSQSSRTSPVATLATDRSGQVGISFIDDDGVISDQGITRIMTELRNQPIKGNPADHELRDFVLARVKFLTDASGKGRPMVRAKNPTEEKANRAKVVSMCMKLIDGEYFKGWASKRIDPVHAAKAEKLRAEISQLDQQINTYRMQDGTEVSEMEYRHASIELEKIRRKMINTRAKIVPKGRSEREWYDTVEDRISAELVAKHTYGEGYKAHLGDTLDRATMGRRVAALRRELQELS